MGVFASIARSCLQSSIPESPLRLPAPMLPCTSDKRSRCIETGHPVVENVKIEDTPFRERQRLHEAGSSDDFTIIPV
jgi:hypothetical protein